MTVLTPGVECFVKQSHTSVVIQNTSFHIALQCMQCTRLFPSPWHAHLFPLLLPPHTLAHSKKFTVLGESLNVCNTEGVGANSYMGAGALHPGMSMRPLFCASNYKITKSAVQKNLPSSQLQISVPICVILLSDIRIALLTAEHRCHGIGL